MLKQADYRNVEWKEKNVAERDSKAIRIINGLERLLNQNRLITLDKCQSENNFPYVVFFSSTTLAALRNVTANSPQHRQCSLPQAFSSLINTCFF